VGGLVRLASGVGFLDEAVERRLADVARGMGLFHHHLAAGQA